MNILFVGLPGVPKRSRACDIRLTFFANLLVKRNAVTILNRYASSRSLKIKDTQLVEKVNVEEIIKPRNTGRFVTAILYILSVLYEPIKIILLDKKHKIDIVHVSSGHYIDFLLYRIISRVIGAKVIYQYVEYRTAFKPRGLYHKINSRLCDRYGMRLFDGVLPISNYLEEKTKEAAPQVPTLKIPPICDFNLFEKNLDPITYEKPYLLFCASVGFEELIKLVVDSYRKSTISKKMSLVLVLSGNRNKIEHLKKEWTDCTILTQLTYNELIAYFKHAYGLFIPLRPIPSDIARFPNKVCEYLASKGLVITTNVGEMSYYFKDGVNAIVADDFSIENMIKCLNKLAQNGYDCDSIRERGYMLGKQLFSVESYELSIQDFLENL